MVFKTQMFNKLKENVNVVIQVSISITVCYAG